MEVSTGHITLDDLALATFRKWRFRPGTVSRVHIPITFYIRGLYVRTWGDRPWLKDVTNWLVPYYPISAIYKGWTGSGVAMLKIDTTGAVSSAQMLKSTGHQVLDRAAVYAFRQWHFKPGTLTSLRIPIEFARARTG
jgi:TonB family protein